MLTSKCNTSASNNYIPELNTTPELKAGGLFEYQELTKVLRFEVELGRIDINFEVSMLSSYLVLPRLGYHFDHICSGT